MDSPILNYLGTYISFVLVLFNFRIIYARIFSHTGDSHIATGMENVPIFIRADIAEDELEKLLGKGCSPLRDPH